MRIRGLCSDPSSIKEFEVHCSVVDSHNWCCVLEELPWPDRVRPDGSATILETKAAGHAVFGDTGWNTRERGGCLLGGRPGRQAAGRSGRRSGCCSGSRRGDRGRRWNVRGSRIGNRPQKIGKPIVVLELEERRTFVLEETSTLLSRFVRECVNKRRCNVQSMGLE